MSVFGNVLTGASSGAMTGTTISPGWGTAIGAGVGAGVGLYRGLQRKKADSMLPEDQDPMQTGLLNELDRRVNNARTGANVANEMAQVGAFEGAGLRALSRGGAGAMGQFGLMNRMAGDRRNQLLATGLQQETQLLGMKQGLISDMEKRKKFLDLLRSEKISAQGEQDSQDLAKGSNAMLTELLKKKSPVDTSMMTGLGGADSPIPMDMAQIEAAGSSPIMGFGGMPLGI